MYFNIIKNVSLSCIILLEIIYSTYGINFGTARAENTNTEQVLHMDVAPPNSNADFTERIKRTSENCLEKQKFTLYNTYIPNDTEHRGQCNILIAGLKKKHEEDLIRCEAKYTELREQMHFLRNNSGGFNFNAVHKQMMDLNKKITLLQEQYQSIQNGGYANSKIPDHYINYQRDINNTILEHTRQYNEIRKEVELLKIETKKMKLELTEKADKTLMDNYKRTCENGLNKYDAAINNLRSQMNELNEENRKMISNITATCGNCNGSNNSGHSSGKRIPTKHARGQVIYAINCAGPAHIGANNIHYMRDPLVGNAATWTWLQNKAIGRASPQDYELYRTVRWTCDQHFNYNIPLPDDGNYVLVIKFIEGNKYSPDIRVFDVLLNNQFVLVSKLDVFARAGVEVAYDRSFEFSIDNGYVVYGDQRSVHDGVITVDFIKSKDCADVAAMYVMAGTKEDIPKYPYTS